MGSGVSGLYKGASLGQYHIGSIDFMAPNDGFSVSIKKRIDIDANGFFDIIGHGDAKTIKIQHNGKQVLIDHRTLARLIKNNPEASGKNIRLLSCNTGKIAHGFAQGLADKLGVDVKAPSDYLWVYDNGNYFIAAGKWNSKTQKLEPIISKPGAFIPYHPQRRKRK